jgi:predicted 2-oxoglutarate/Fe(II)-dependent dioxygenase YbiX
MNLKDYIYVVSNALSNKLCDELINEYEKSEDWVQTEIASGLDKSIRNHYHDQNRSVSCSFALNDDFEGGEFAFFDRELKYKLGKGDAIMFPSNFMYPHEVMPVTKGTRYSIITWFI